MTSTPVHEQPDRTAEYELLMAEFVERTVAQFPDLTPDQRARLAVLLRPDTDLDTDVEAA